MKIITLLYITFCVWISTGKLCVMIFGKTGITIVLTVIISLAALIFMLREMSETANNSVS